LSEDKEGGKWIERLKKITPKMSMASAWLFKNTNLDTLLDSFGNYNKSITYHDPCHAKKVLGIHKEPRLLLARNFSLREMSEADRCCGFGGVSMQSDRYALTLKAGSPKAKMIKESGAEIVSAECSACRMQITNALYNNNVKASFVHPIELIANVLLSKPIKEHTI